MIDFDCPECREPLSVPSCLAGMTDRCPTCGHDVPVPVPPDINPLTGISNPFRGTVVTDAWAVPEADVREIHKEAFKLCLRGIGEVRKTHKSTSILLHGEAGSGKTHLMARLRRELGKFEPPREVIFIAIQLRTAPDMIWRHIRKRVVEDLFRRCDGADSQFHRVVERRLASVNGGGLELLAERGVGRDLRLVLAALLQGQHTQMSYDWLHGDSLPDRDLECLGLAVRTEQYEDQEQAAQEIVIGICQLAAPEVPIVLCFDQIEAMVRSSDEGSALSEFAKVVGTLHDATRNLLLISCIQSSYEARLYTVIDDAYYQHRLARLEKTALLPLRFDQAGQLITARMACDEDLARLRKGEGKNRGFWPLSEGKLKDFFDGQTGHAAVARRVLAHSADLFDAARSGVMPAAEPEETFLDRTWEEREEKAIKENAPSDTDEILHHALPFLAEIAKGDYKPESETGNRDIDMSFMSPGARRVEVSLCNEQSMNKLVCRLKRLCKGVAQGRFQKLVLVRDVRSAIPRTAVKTREYLSTMRKDGAILVRPSVGALAALDTMRKLLSDAKAGDLANGERTVEPTTVEQWLRANLPDSLGDLLQQVLSPDIADAPPEPEGLLDLVRERRVARLNQVAKELDHPAASVEAWIRANGELVGILNGPPRVIFQVVPDSIAAEGPEGN